MKNNSLFRVRNKYLSKLLEPRNLFQRKVSGKRISNRSKTCKIYSQSCQKCSQTRQKMCHLTPNQINKFLSHLYSNNRRLALSNTFCSNLCLNKALILRHELIPKLERDLWKSYPDRNNLITTLSVQVNLARIASIALFNQQDNHQLRQLSRVLPKKIKF